MIIHYQEGRQVLKKFCNNEKGQPYELTPHINFEFITCEDCIKKLKNQSNSEKASSTSFCDL